MKVVRVSIALLAIALAPSGARADQLLVNGGFETGDFTGWAQGGNTGATAVQNGASLAHSGNFAAALGPVGSLGTLSQTLTTTPGTHLYLNFWLASDGGLPNELNVSLGGNLSLHMGNITAQAYRLYSFDTVASGATTLLSFSFRDDPGYLRLDDVSVTTTPNDPVTWPPGTGGTVFTTSVTPEPGSLALLSIGGLGLLFGARRRRRAGPRQ